MAEVDVGQNKMPVLFLAHGSPMNAIEDNDFTRSLTKLGSELPKPKAILMVSAHWETDETWVTGMDRPRTIHDFRGFPKELFDVQYPAPGAPGVAQSISETILDPKIHIDKNNWGLDHGTWSVLKHLFPNADVPVLQMSLDRNKTFEYHLKLGRSLKFLRSQGVMIIGSGNIVHNLKEVNWSKNPKAYDWAVEFDSWVKRKVSERNFEDLASCALKTESGQLSIPTPEHYLPLLYSVGASDFNDTLVFDYEGIQMSSMSMRCIRFF